jgi:hypothetical protein
MRQEKKHRSPRREAPVQFRPSIELGQRTTAFAAKHDLEASETRKCLLALGVRNGL